MTFMDELRQVRGGGFRARHPLVQAAAEMRDEMRASLKALERQIERDSYFYGLKTKCSVSERMPRWLRGQYQCKGIERDGSFTGYASIFDELDCERDRVLRGAFAESIRRSAGNVPMLWQHMRREPVGSARELEEDAIGLKFRGRIQLESARGKEAFAFLRDGHLDQFSIGYYLPDDGFRRRPDGGRDLHKIDLREISIVSVACCGGARVS